MYIVCFLYTATLNNLSSLQQWPVDHSTVDHTLRCFDNDQWSEPHFQVFWQLNSQLELSRAIVENMLKVWEYSTSYCPKQTPDFYLIMDK